MQPPQVGYGPSANARAEIPAAYLRLYQDAGRRNGIDPWVLAAIGWVETAHGRMKAPGVRRQRLRLLRGPDAVLNRWFPQHLGPLRPGRQRRRAPLPVRAGGRDPGRRALPAQQRRAGDYRAALFAYNHADWYVSEVLAKAPAYRGALRGGLGDIAIDPATLRDILADPRILLTPVQQADLEAGGVDQRTSRPAASTHGSCRRWRGSAATTAS